MYGILTYIYHRFKPFMDRQMFHSHSALNWFTACQQEFFSWLAWMSRDGSFRSKVNGSVGDVTPRNTLFIGRLNHPLIRSPLIRSQLPTNGTSKKTRDKTLVGQGTIGSLRKGCHHRIGYLQRDPTSAGGFGGGWVPARKTDKFFSEEKFRSA